MPYMPRPVKAPRLAGLSLRAFATLAASPGLGGVVRARMLDQLGIARLRAARVEDAPGRWMWTPPAEGDPVPDVPALIGAPHTGPGFRFPSIADYLDGYRTGRTDPVE